MTTQSSSEFDEIIDRRNTHSAKWDRMEKVYGVPSDGGLPMWVADTDFRAPQVVLDRLQAAIDHGVFGYVDNSDEFNAAIQWWMKNRHGWEVQADWIFTTTGIVNAVGMCLDAFTAPGDGIVVFTPVYHAFAKVINAAGRRVVELPMIEENGRHKMDFASYDALLDGSEKMVILCSPHNPGGTVWTKEELCQLGEFSKRHDLLLVSDEIHHDLVFPGEKHLPMPVADPSIIDRLLMLTAPSKTFNVAGLHTGNVIIQDEALRETFAARMRAINLSGNSLGDFVLASAYSPEGAEWVDAQMAYLDENRKIFDAAVNSIPGLKSMPLQATYLSWVDFSDTGMSAEEFYRRVEQDAKIAINHGDTFGTGGESCARFNIGTQRARIEDACARLKKAFADLQ